MEEAQLMPLIAIFICLTYVTPLVGFPALAYIWFLLKDKELAKRILTTIIIVAILPVLYMGYEFISTFLLMPKCCLGNSYFTLSQMPEILIGVISELLRRIFLSFTVSFLISFVFVVPITLIARKRKKSKTAQGVIP